MEKQEKEEGGGEGVEEVRLQQGRFNIGIKAGARSSRIHLFPGDPVVLWIRNILVWIRIRGSANPLINGYGSCFFRP